MMEAVRTSETSVNVNVTARRYTPEDSKPHTRRHDNDYGNADVRGLTRQATF